MIVTAGPEPRARFLKFDFVKNVHNCSQHCNDDIAKFSFPVWLTYLLVVQWTRLFKFNLCVKAEYISVSARERSQHVYPLVDAMMLPQRFHARHPIHSSMLNTFFVSFLLFFFVCYFLLAFIIYLLLRLRVIKII